MRQLDHCVKALRFNGTKLRVNNAKVKTVSVMNGLAIVSSDIGEIRLAVIGVGESCYKE
jgi:hypothetical protein